MTAQEEPTRDELMAMAYADGELPEAEAREFEEKLATRSDLALEVTQLKRLQVLARQVSPPEPIDHEWERLAADPVHQTGVGFGLVAVVFGAVGLAAWGTALVLSSDLGTTPKALISLLIVGFLSLLLTAARARARTAPFDPYTEVRR